MLSVCVLLLVVCCGGLVSCGDVASWTECNWETSHGFVLSPNPSCTSFYIFHLGEFECPHQMDVKAQVVFEDPKDEAAFCQVRVSFFKIFFF